MLDFEVFSALKEPVEMNQDMKTLDFELQLYFKNQPCFEQTQTNIVNLMMALNDWKLYKIEKLMIINLAPQSSAELHPLIEECPTRFTEDELSALLDLIKLHIPWKRPEVERED